MDYQTAERVLQKNLKLIGRRIGGKKIADLVILPQSGEFLNQILFNNRTHRANDHIYSRFNKFDVVVLYEETLTSNILVVEKDPLEFVLSNLKTAV